MKGNLFLGYGRGSVGDVVFSRQGGQQVGRARNRKPNNPRSKKQMAQRSLFADAVKFFTRGRQALFQFAFESKSAAESDYNAFMRLNAKNGVMLAPQMIEDINFPAIGEWIMSQGSLPSLVISRLMVDDEFVADVSLGVDGSEQAAAITVAKLTQYLVDTGDWEVGDILTLVCIESSSSYESGQVTPVLVGSSAPVWKLAQLVLDAADTRTVAAALGSDVVELINAGDEYRIRFISTTDDTLIAGYCAIHSRITPSGLKVSTQQLFNSRGAVAAIQDSRTSMYRDFIMYQWGASDTAILEGGITHGRH